MLGHPLTDISYVQMLYPNLQYHTEPLLAIRATMASQIRCWESTKPSACCWTLWNQLSCAWPSSFIPSVSYPIPVLLLLLLFFLFWKPRTLCIPISSSYLSHVNNRYIYYASVRPRPAYQFGLALERVIIVSVCRNSVFFSFF